MIIFDLNQVMISNLMAQIGNHTNTEIEESLLRHMVINSIRMNVARFKDTYLEVVIACDDKNYWRRDVFPHYKAHRKRDREKSELDWNLIFRTLNKIRDEIKEYFPYKVIQVDRAEADDIIGALVREFPNQEILLLSGDKDFIQLHTNPNVKQYSPITKQYIKHDSPDTYLKEHIIKGDRGDGIPNIASYDDTFVSGSRQKPVRKALYQRLIETDLDNISEEFKQFERNFKRNKMLIDLNETPQEIVNQTLNQYYSQHNKQNKILEYLMKFKLKTLVEKIGDF